MHPTDQTGCVFGVTRVSGRRQDHGDGRQNECWVGCRVWRCKGESWCEVKNRIHARRCILNFTTSGSTHLVDFSLMLEYGQNCLDGVVRKKVTLPLQSLNCHSVKAQSRERVFRLGYILHQHPPSHPSSQSKLA